MQNWQLLDFLQPLGEGQEESPRTVVQSEEQLRAELSRLRQRRPAMVALVNPQGERLDFGIGGPWSGIQWTTPPYSDNFKTAVASTAPVTSSIEFACEGSVSGFRPEHVLSVEVVMEAVIYFFKHHQLPDWLTWLEWNSRTNEKRIIPPRSSMPTAPTFALETSTRPPASP